MRVRLLAHTELTTLLEVFKDNLQLMVLNACGSASYVRAIVRIVPFAVGMPPELPTEGAVVFYRALRRRDSNRYTTHKQPQGFRGFACINSYLAMWVLRSNPPESA